MTESHPRQSSRLVFALTLLLGTCGFMARPAAAVTAPDWIFMDLGEVIVTGNPTAGYTFVPGAREFLKAARLAGYKLALVSNIPESWGSECTAKYKMLQQFLGSRLHEESPMDWTALDAVIVPPFDRYRKPEPFMFVRALATACPGRALYIGEEAGELTVAKQWGYATLEPQDASHISHLPSMTTVAHLLDHDYSFSQPALCDFAAHFHDVVLPEDHDMDVTRCVITP